MGKVVLYKKRDRTQKMGKRVQIISDALHIIALSIAVPCDAKHTVPEI